MTEERSLGGRGNLVLTPVTAGAELCLGHREEERTEEEPGEDCALKSVSVLEELTVPFGTEDSQLVLCFRTGCFHDKALLLQEGQSVQRAFPGLRSQTHCKPQSQTCSVLLHQVHPLAVSPSISGVQGLLIWGLVQQWGCVCVCRGGDLEVTGSEAFNLQRRRLVLGEERLGQDTDVICWQKGGCLFSCSESVSTYR